MKDIVTMGINQKYKSNRRFHLEWQSGQTRELHRVIPSTSKG